MFDFSPIRKSMKDLTGQVSTLRAQMAELRAERERLETAPLCKSDVLELIEDAIDYHAQEYPKRLLGGLQSLIHHRRPMDVFVRQVDHTRGTGGGSQQLRVLTAHFASANPAVDASSLELQANLFYFFKDQLKAGVRQALAKADFKRAGVPINERLTRCNEIAAQLERLAKGEADLLAEAQKSGVDLSAIA